MSSSSLIRAGGLATILAGALLIVTGIAAFMIPLDSGDTAEEFTTSGYALIAWLSVVGLMLLQIGLVTMYAERSRALGVTGLVGFVAAFFSTDPGLSVGGSGANRILAVTAAAKRTGTATITVTVSAGQSSGTVPITVGVGSDLNDTLSGTSGADIIFGKNGNDAITGQDGNDLPCGGNGAGSMSGGEGDDTLDGAKGNDVLLGYGSKDILRGGGGDDTLTGGTEADSFSGGAGTDKATDFNAAEGDTKDATLP